MRAGKTEGKEGVSELGPQGNVRSVGVSLSGSRALSSVLLLSGQNM